MTSLSLNPETVVQELGYRLSEVNSRLRLLRPRAGTAEKSFAEEIAYGLMQESKFIHPKFFYDIRGSELFEQICDLPEYYLTRTEISLLESLKDTLGPFLDGSYRLVELGSGSSVKTRLLLDILHDAQDRVEYTPIDVSEILAESSQGLLDDYPRLHIAGVIDTYERGLQFVKGYDDLPNIFAFLGSSLGNFEPDRAADLLNRVRLAMKDRDLFLVGLDLIKSPGILEAAYDDGAGVTAQFNLNVLRRINRELDGDFDLDGFSHVAVFNKKHGRIEMYLRSKKRQAVRVMGAGLDLNFEEGEMIHTEHSHKFTEGQIESMMADADMRIRRVWKKDGYALVLASAS